jgi:hypothetical protein
MFERPVARFRYFPVIAADVSELELAALRKLPELFVHESDFSSYLNVLKALEWAAEQGTVLQNVSLSPGPGAFDPREPMNVATRALAEGQRILVFAAGNDGPEIASLSPWCAARWVIGVGAATETGDALLEESSIGSPADAASGPTVVAPGRTVVPLRAGGVSAHGTMVGLVLIGKDIAGQNRPGLVDVPFTGTSVAAPKVARICGILLNILYIIGAIDSLLKKSADDASAEAIERACALIRVREHVEDPEVGILAPLPTVNFEALLRFFKTLASSGAYPRELFGVNRGTVPFPTSWIKRLLVSMARPVPNCQPHQVGAGFTSEPVAVEFLRRFSSADLLRLFELPETDALLAQWPDAEQPLIPPAIIDYAIRKHDSGIRLAAARAV